MTRSLLLCFILWSSESMATGHDLPQLVPFEKRRLIFLSSRHLNICSMLKEQLGSVSETEHKATVSLGEPYNRWDSVQLIERIIKMIKWWFRPPTSCADTAVQCYIEDELSPEEPDRERERERFLYEKIDNPLSDTSTWNTELPNIGNLLLRLRLRLSDLQIIETF